MRELLAERGVPERQTVLEDRAADTRENFKNSAKLIDPAAPVGVVSSNYHIHRAMRLAKSAGFANAQRMPAPSDPLRFGANVMWEIIMELNDLAHGK